jgi:pilus assembly protein Flp/PilA
MLMLYVKLQTALQSLKDERGQDLIEYALLAALIAVACTAIMGTLATSISTEFGKITAKLT